MKEPSGTYLKLSERKVRKVLNRRSQWPRGLRREFAAARLLRLWVPIPPGAWMFVVLCVKAEVSATS